MDSARAGEFIVGQIVGHGIFDGDGSTGGFVEQREISAVVS